ncbi:MAG: molybdenum cofactor biosynthesis protein D/E [Phycisphaerae bacterium]|nr:MAG: molybdenum cofactor biosynthesis protein D/E [Phycisphaerae bacterium]
MQTIHLNLFGPARDFAGTDAMPIELPDGATVGDLATGLAEKFPKWRAGLQTVRYAINDVFVTSAHQLVDGDQVAVIPPVSGGMAEPEADLIVLTPDPLNIAHCYAHLAAESTGEGGGVCVFVGKTRAETSETHGPLKHLDYEAHESMAIVQMKQLASQARERWSVCSVALCHRIGTVGIGESSVVIGVASGHRDESFQACRWLIDKLKREVPIWKCEVWESGERTWSKGDQAKAADCEAK